ncbi:MAG: hypothetical protein LLG02_00145 [Pelosinus sp.]|nr:hypothetical protein [Pelosinus sp.]
MNEDKVVHDICIDKTSCRHVSEGKNQAETGSYGSTPTEQLTKDSIRKRYQEMQRKAPIK